MSMYVHRAIKAPLEVEIEANLELRKTTLVPCVSCDREERLNERWQSNGQQQRLWQPTRRVGRGRGERAEARSAELLTKQHSSEDRVPIKINLPFWCHHTDKTVVTFEVLCDHRTRRPLCILKQLLIHFKLHSCYKYTCCRINDSPQRAWLREKSG